jgi:beta-phosphoglucomutase family hydrolase
MLPEGPMQKQAFIFDMDGTLLDNTAFHTSIWLEVLASQGVHLDHDTFNRHTAGKTNKQLLREQVGDNLTDGEIEKLTQRKEALYRQRYLPHMRPLNGLIEFLQAARRLDFRMALATSAGSENVAFTMSNLGLGGFFDAIVDSTNIHHSKPHPEMFLKAAHQLGAPAVDCIVFEDSLAGIEAARRAGMRAVVITTSLAQTELPQAGILRAVPDYTHLDPASLLEVRS